MSGSGCEAEVGEAIMVPVEPSSIPVYEVEEEDERGIDRFGEVLPHIYIYLSSADKQTLRLVNKSWREGVDYFRVFRQHRQSPAKAPAAATSNEEAGCGCQSQLTQLENELTRVKDQLAMMQVQIAQIMYFSSTANTQVPPSEETARTTEKEKETPRSEKVEKLEETARAPGENKKRKLYSSAPAPHPRKVSEKLTKNLTAKRRRLQGQGASAEDTKKSSRRKKKGKRGNPSEEPVDEPLFNQETADPPNVESGEEEESEIGIAYRCPYCTKCFASRDGLVRHLKLHQQGKAFKCRKRKCGKTYRSQSSLMNHMNVHEGRYKCPTCKKKCSSQANLEEHIMSHAVDRPFFECEKCGKKFTRKSGLDGHEQGVHAKQPRFSCGDCGRQFTWSNSLRRHLCKTQQGAKTGEGGDPPEEHNPTTDSGGDPLSTILNSAINSLFS